MLGLTVAKLVAGVCGPVCHAQREVGEQRGDKIGAGVHRLGHEPETVGFQSHGQFDRDEKSGGPDRGERDAPCRGHTSSDCQSSTSWLEAQRARGGPLIATGISSVRSTLTRASRSRHGEWWQSAR